MKEVSSEIPPQEPIEAVEAPDPPADKPTKTAKKASKKASSRKKAPSRKKAASKKTSTPEEVPDIYGQVDEVTETFPSGCTILDLALGGGYAKKRIINIVGDECLAGSTEVSVSRGGRPKKMSIETLYQRHHGDHPNRNEEATTRVLCDLGGHVGLNELVDVYKSGVKMLYRILDDRGAQIEASANHPFLTASGYRSINEGLAVGDEVVVWDGQGSWKRARHDRRVIHSIQHHPFGWAHRINGKNYKRLTRARLVIEADMNGVPLEELVDILRNDAVRASTLKFSDATKAVHHIDGDPTNDALGNLELLDIREHGIHHGDDFVKNAKRLVMSQIVSIEQIGERPTYDLSMRSPFNNFIADGFVVHNSTGKTLLVMEAAALFHHTYKDAVIRYAECESAFDKQYMRNLGIPIEAIEDTREIRTVEQWDDDLGAYIEKYKGTSTPLLYIVDSLDALSDEAELSSDIRKGSYKMQKAKLLGEIFRRRVCELSDVNITIIIVSQVRAKIDAMVGRKTTRSGGKALDFYASQIFWLNRAHRGKLSRTISGVERTTGVMIQAKVEKNKVGPAFREAFLPIQFNYGVDDLHACVKFLRDVKRTDEVGLSDAQAGRLIVGIPKMNDEVYDEQLKLFQEAARDVWVSIEESFAPKRKKYRTS